jgi:hypothetical protein
MTVFREDYGRLTRTTLFSRIHTLGSAINAHTMNREAVQETPVAVRPPVMLSLQPDQKKESPKSTWSLPRDWKPRRCHLNTTETLLQSDSPTNPANLTRCSW